MKNKAKRFISVITSMCLILTSIMSVSITASADTQTDAIDYTKSLIYGVKPNSWIIHDENLKDFIDSSSNKPYAQTAQKVNFGHYYDFFTDADVNNNTVLNEFGSNEHTSGKYGAFMNKDNEYRNQNDTLEVYHDFVFPLDEKTGKAVSVNKFVLSAADGCPVTKFEVYFSSELNRLTDKDSLVINYDNENAPATNCLSFENSVIANYMLVRITRVKCNPENQYSFFPNIKEIAVFGDDNPTLGYTVTDNKTDVQLSDSVILNNGILFNDNNFTTGTYNKCPDWYVSSFSGLTDGDGAVKYIDVVRFNQDSKTLNVGNGLERTLDVVTSLTEKTGKQTNVKGLYIKGHSDKLYAFYKYSVYISNTLEHLTDTESLVGTFCNKDTAESQYIELATPVTGAYLLIRFTMGKPVLGHGTNSPITDWTAGCHLSEIAVFGDATTEYDLAGTTTYDLKDSVIYGTVDSNSMVQATDNGPKEASMYFTNAYGVITDGSFEKAINYGYHSGGNGNEGKDRYSSYGSNYFLRNNSSKLEMREDFIFDLREKYNNAVDVESFVIGTGNGEPGKIYKFEIYASNSRDELCSPKNLVATASNELQSSIIAVNLKDTVTANYVMLRVIFSHNYKLGYYSYMDTKISEFAVFGTEHKGYTVSVNTEASDELYKSYISGVNPIETTIYDNGEKYTLGNKDDLYKSTDSSIESATSFTTAGADNKPIGAFFDANNKRRNHNNNLDVYTDVVYRLSAFGSAEINEIFVAEAYSEKAVEGENAWLKIFNSYSYEIYVSDTLENLGSEETFVASILNPNGGSTNLVKFDKPISGKYIMFRNTMGAQKGFNQNYNMSVARNAEFAVFGEESFIAGDVNSDNAVNILDLVRFKKYLASNDVDFNSNAADLDEDGNDISSSDLATLRKYLMFMHTAKSASYEKDGELTQKMIDVSRANTGNRVRLGEKLAEFENGGAFTIAFIGGAQTAGSGLENSDNSYVAGVKAWLEKTYPKATFTIVNVGEANTDSSAAIKTLSQSVLEADPSLVFVEYSLSDSMNNLQALEDYQQILKTVWNHTSSPAVVALGFADKFMQSAQSAHLEAVKQYDIPMISYGDVVKMLINDKTLEREDLFADSNTTALGHKIASQLIASYLEDASVWYNYLKAPEKAEVTIPN